MCKRAVRLKALEGFSSVEFTNTISSRDIIIEHFLSLISQNFPFLSQPASPSLPYFTIYKIHKDSFRWLTNAHDCLFSPITNCITSGLQCILSILKDFTEELHCKLKTFSQVETNALWLIESQYDFLVNLPQDIMSCHTFDVTSCYEAIPHTGPYSLMEALKNLCKICSKQGFIGFTIENSSNLSPCKKSKNDRILSFESFLQLNLFTLQNCFMQLGPIIKQQMKGIPMGYSCSPLWCNLYLTSFEISFIMRLSTLSCFQYLKAFKLSSRFIDDLAFVNNPFLVKFLDPSQPLLPSNSLWIYPLHIIQLKNTTNMCGNLTLITTYLCTSINLIRPFIGKYSSSLVWKKDKLPCKNISYIYADSTLR